VRDKRNREGGRLGVLLLLLALFNPAHMRQVVRSLLQLDARHAEKTLFITRATQTDADSAWADYLLTEHVVFGGRW
jgi:hypothetical protein